VRIALLSYEYPPETGFGGIGTYTRTQARALARLGHEVHVIAGATAPRELGSTLEEGVRVWRFRGGPRRWAAVLGRLRLFWSRNRLENGIDMARALARVLARHPLDLVEAPECGAEALRLASLMPGRVVVRFHSPAELILPFYDVPALDRWLCARLERRALRAAAGFTSASAFLAREARERLGVRAPIATIPNGIDPAEGAPAPGEELRAALGVAPGTPVVLFAGRIERRKGADVAAAVAARLLPRRRLAFVFAGDDLFGWLARELLPPLEALGGPGSVHALGRLPLGRARAALAAADVVLVPSRWENCPYVVLEAMAAGRAVVASDATGLPELVEQGVTGLAAPDGDAEAHAAAVERLLDDPGLARRLGAAARARVEGELSDVAVARRSLEVYRRVVDAAPRRAGRT